MFKNVKEKVQGLQGQKEDKEKSDKIKEEEQQQLSPTKLHLETLRLNQKPDQAGEKVHLIIK